MAGSAERRWTPAGLDWRRPSCVDLGLPGL